MPVIRAAETVVHEMHNTRFTAMVRPGTGSTELCVWRIEIAPGTVGVAHTIHREEAFVVLSGTAILTIDGEASPVEVGDAAVANAGSIISLTNPGADPATLLVTTSVGFTGELPDGTIVNPPWVN
ncbi:cupin domain-containing protein [Nocardia uniformis]|uniref:Cupin domain-containing protein n=1 Tax=Nocardia uniformis TaxID=53432 RepID=A0A849C554_9NOCA|nr:cupin domain-containing protein [Nocardia uniformis]NNH73762.1 cupin domain-containing protein [Nocardia uniformis]